MSLPLFSRSIFTALFSICALLMAFALYLEFGKGLEPCPLCMAQRVAVSGIGLVCLIAALHNPMQAGIRVYSLFMLFFSAAGAALAGRQVWLQNLPEDQIPACGPGIYYMLDVFPLTDTIRSMLMGSGDCAEVVWRDPVIGLSIPGWTLVWFSVISCLALYMIVKPTTKNRSMGN